MSRRLGRRPVAALGLTIAIVLASTGAWQASAPTHVSLQDRAIAVERTLRCPTCQGLSIADSPSPIAAGMRRQVEEQLAAGSTPAQVRGYFTARYGDWILLAPPGRGLGWLIWAAPLLLLLVGLLVLRRTLRRRPRATATTSEEITAAQLLADEPPRLNLPETVAAAVTDVRAAQLEAEADPAAAAGAELALERLADSLRTHPIDAAEGSLATRGRAAPTAPSAPAAVRGHQRLRFVPPLAAVVFAALLGTMLTHNVGARPAGAPPTGDLAGAATATTPDAPGDVNAWRDATRARPHDAATWLAYATSLDQAERLSEAEPVYRRALALDPSSVAAREQLAWLLTRGGSAGEALTLLGPLERSRPNDPEVVLLIGLAQRSAGQPAANTTLRRYLRLTPSSPQAAMVRKLLEQSSR